MGYQIRVRGKLDERWSDWFSDLAITTEGESVTVLSGAVDQSALRGILNKVWDLNLALISVLREGQHQLEEVGDED